MKVLASTAMLGAQVAMPELAFAQAQCPPIGTPCVVGVPQGPAPCPVGAYCSSDPGGYGYTGGGGSGGSNSIPENEATAPRPAPPPKPQWKINQDLAFCDADYAKDRATEDPAYSAALQGCYSKSWPTVERYLEQLIDRGYTLPMVLRAIGFKTTEQCVTDAKLAYKVVLAELDVKRAECRVNAYKP